MGFASPKQHKDDYKNQEGGRFKRVTPVSGTFDVVNTKIQFQTIGQYKTEKLRIITHVLRVVQADDQEGATAMVGETFGQDIWWHKPVNPDPQGIEDCDFNLVVKEDGKTLAFNGMKLMNMAMAHGASDDFENEIVERDLVGLVTGVPHRVKIEVEIEESGAKKYYNVETVEVKHLPAAARKRYTDVPEYKKVIGKADERLLEPADYSRGKGDSDGGSTGSADSNDDGFSDDDDLPF